MDAGNYGGLSGLLNWRTTQLERYMKKNKIDIPYPVVGYLEGFCSDKNYFYLTQSKKNKCNVFAMNKKSRRWKELPSIKEDFVL